jgi:hypothetical protein
MLSERDLATLGASTVEVPPDESHFVVVLGANSAMRFPDDPVPLLVRQVPTEIGPADLIFRTRYSEEGYEAPVPRELWIEARGSTAAEFDSAINAYGRAAHSFLGFIGLSANAAVEDPEVKIAFDNTAGRDEHPYFAQFVPEARGVPLPGRLVDGNATAELLDCFNDHSEFDRLTRAVEQYRTALVNWRPGREILALAHLFMGMEALTKVALRRELEREALSSPADLAARWGIEIKALDGEVRRRILFRGDAETTAKAKKASDGFEHGFLHAMDIRQLATEARDKTATYLRTAILDLVGASDDLRATLTKSPFDTPLNPWVVRYMRGTLRGDAEELAAPDQHYPIFRWHSKLKSHKRNDDGSYTIEMEENLTARFNPELKFERSSFEMWGSREGLIGRPEFTAEPEKHTFQPDKEDLGEQSQA